MLRRQDMMPCHQIQEGSKIKRSIKIGNWREIQEPKSHQWKRRSDQLFNPRMALLPLFKNRNFKNQNCLSMNKYAKETLKSGRSFFKKWRYPNWKLKLLLEFPKIRPSVRNIDFFCQFVTNVLFNHFQQKLSWKNITQIYMHFDLWIFAHIFYALPIDNLLVL